MNDDSVPPGQSPQSEDASSGVERRPSPKKADEELAALRSEVQKLRKDLARAQAECDRERKAVQALYVKLHPEVLVPIDPATLTPRPAGTPDILEEVLAEMERLGYDPL